MAVKLTALSVARSTGLRGKSGLDVVIDGPGELDGLNGKAGPGQAAHRTERIEAGIARLCREGRPPRLLVTLHRLNATAERLPRMFAWMRELDTLGVRSVRLQPLVTDSPALRLYALADEEYVRAFLGFARLQKELNGLRFDILGEIERRLLGHDDAQTAGAVRGGDPVAELVKAGAPGYERYLALQQTPQEDGGCKGCRFFLICRGKGPGTAIDGDWRNRSALCGVWKRLFLHVESELVLANRMPLTLSPLRPRLERHLSLLWETGRNASIRQLPRSEPPARAHDRLSLPPFVRQTFADERQRAVWQPRFDAVVAALPRMALAAVSRDTIPAARVTVAASDVAVLRAEASRRGLRLRVLSVTGEGGRSRHAVVGTRAAADAAERAWNTGDLAAFDQALGVPACCRQAAMARLERGQIDAVWQAAGAVSDVADVIPATPATNVLFRPLGIDLLGYFPCSLDCEASRTRGEALLEAGAMHEREAEREATGWLETILSWPAEWSALHGIAEVRTAIVNIAYVTDYTPSKVTFIRRGVAVTADAARERTLAYGREPAFAVRREAALAWPTGIRLAIEPAFAVRREPPFAHRHERSIQREVQP